jgi:polyhydroxybutyrate depolymerase
VRIALLMFATVACGSAPGATGGDAAGTADAAVQDGHAPIDAPASCGMRTGMRGKTSRTVMVGGLNRTYLVYLPEMVSPTEALPLVFVHHGYTMSGQNMYDITGYAALADREHVAVAFPDGQGGASSLGAPWNVGTNVCNSVSGPPPLATGDDFAFLDAMKADIVEDQCLDLGHVFVTGFSMGGFFAHHAGCDGTGIRGVAPHSGGTHELSSCTNVEMPVIMFHGAADPVIPAGCDDPSAVAVPEGAAAARWAAHNGCATTTHSHAVQNGTCTTWDGCPAGGQVELCTFNNMGHCWAGGVGPSIYACEGYEGATELEWSFWKTNAW